MAHAWLSLGSNLDPVRHLDDAIEALGKPFHVVAVSRWYRSAAAGFAGPDFLNLAVLLETPDEKHTLQMRLRKLEDALGRDRSGPRWSSRTIDIDLIFYDPQTEAGSHTLELVREELHQPFVLRPLCDLSPELVPGGADHRTLQERWLDLSDELRHSLKVEPKMRRKTD